jgi:hypothetical protein
MSSHLLTRKSFNFSKRSSNLRCRWSSDQQLTELTIKTKLFKNFLDRMKKINLKKNLEVSLINKNKLWCQILNPSKSVQCQRLKSSKLV